MTNVSQLGPAARAPHYDLLIRIARDLEQIRPEALVVLWSTKRPNGDLDSGSRGLGTPAELVYLCEEFKMGILSGDVNFIPADQMPRPDTGRMIALPSGAIPSADTPETP